MTREEKIDKIIVNLFTMVLRIEDDDILSEIEDSLKQKNIVTKERILAELYEKSNEQKDLFSKMELEIKMAKNKIAEGYDAYFDNREINSLLS